MSNSSINNLIDSESELSNSDESQIENFSPGTNKAIIGVIVLTILITGGYFLYKYKYSAPALV